MVPTLATDQKTNYLGEAKQPDPPPPGVATIHDDTTSSDLIYDSHLHVACLLDIKMELQRVDGRGSINTTNKPVPQLLIRRLS